MQLAPKQRRSLFADIQHRPSHRLRHRVATGDGWHIALYEYSPGKNVAKSDLPPVVLCHGAFSRFHIYDWGGGGGLAPYLAGLGRRVFAVELRGRGDSLPRSPRGRKRQYKQGWTIDDLLNHDVPATLDFVTRHTGAGQVDWVGHSMGGMLMLAHLSQAEDPRVRRVVTVGSADFRFLGENDKAGSHDPRKGERRRVDLAQLMSPITRRLPVIPARPFMRGLAVAAPWVPAKYKATAYHAPNVERGLERRYLWHGFTNVSSRKFREFIRLPDPEGLSRYQHPTLFIAGERDLLVPPRLVQRTFERAGSADKRYLLFSKDQGHSADYGHGDLLIGKQAPQEVFPHIAQFLSQEAGAVSRREGTAPTHEVRSFPLPHGITLVGDAYGDQRAYKAGKAPGVLLLHGGGQTRHAWGGSAEALARAGFYAIALDLRGHGDSSFAPNGEYHTDHFVQDLRALLELLPHRPALVGASLGGITSLATQDLEAAQGADACSAIVLVDITPKMEVDGIRRILEFMDARPDGFADLEEAADFIAEFLPHRKRPSNLNGLKKNLRQHPDGRWRWHWDPKLMRTWDPNSFDPTEGPKIHAERLAQARRLKVPTLLIRGKQSDVVSEAGAREFLEACPHAEFVDLTGATHMVAGDVNDHFSSAVVDFLNRATRRA
ncbi:MAG: alpha/beta fold hydrolase [Polyangiaceae bacterium]|nr:alpha/beta fold hydrolase [Polyangiaceae bacterium]MCB9607733.1 alpha/beta fold hydrolase [Polyangiaceae bacterium]